MKKKSFFKKLKKEIESKFKHENRLDNLTIKSKKIIIKNIKGEREYQDLFDYVENTMYFIDKEYTKKCLIITDGRKLKLKLI